MSFYGGETAGIEITDYMIFGNYDIFSGII